jgi:hypothetical protein
MTFVGSLMAGALAFTPGIPAAAQEEPPAISVFTSDGAQTTVLVNDSISVSSGEAAPSLLDPAT